MKSLILLISVIFSMNASAKGLQIEPIPIEINEAVDYIYDMGRNAADAGGIYHISLYKNNDELDALEIIKEVMFNSQLSYSANETADVACGDRSQNECAQLVIDKPREVNPNFGYSNIFDFTETLRDWDFEDEANSWSTALDKVDEFTLKTLGEDYQTYSYGYDDFADVFVIIMLSKDGKTILVFEGDYGA